MNKVYYGEADGEKCNRNGCEGTMEAIRKGDGCSCHIHPPCSWCFYDEAVCNVCNHSTNDPDPKPKQLKTWYVYQTFDDVPEKDIKYFLTEDESYELALSRPRSVYTHWHNAPMRMSFLEWLTNINKI